MFVIRNIAGVSNDRCPFGGIRTQAAKVIEVRMRVDDVPDRLTRNDLLNRIEDRDGTGLAFRGLHNGDVVAKLQRNATGAAW